MSLRDFKHLGEDVLLYEPHIKPDDGHHDCCQEPAPKTGAGPPSLIVLCTWLGGATSKRIERYTRRYHNIWPASNILLLRTNLADYLTRSDKSLLRKLRPAHREIRRIAIDTLPDPAKHKPKSTTTDSGILLHIFSQGGTNIATQLVTSLNSILRFLGRDKPLPLRQIVLDSCPGDPDISSTYAAGAHSLPKGHPLRPLGCVVLYVVAVGLAGLEATGLRRPLAKVMRAQLNDPDIFPPSAARLYLTSRADDIVDSRHVEAHVHQAAAKGLRTEMLVFERAGHCSLMLEDESAYWNAIISCWERNGLSQMAGIHCPGTAASSVDGHYERRSRL
ncbi:hypothetical protein VSDG_09426 [Cytospora chrysosperma]|uniref:Peptidase S9 prolyl oligopeptidase catalytic domain-containing protein n=1 Tax=Cytospora chrysosperma TaxID=252740 RepID=A0A423VBN9_CYTCH|nr:hypothetical protein VSDG_09426 [Valsa sordida]